jgi:hypothetical protein
VSELRSGTCTKDTSKPEMGEESSKKYLARVRACVTHHPAGPCGDWPLRLVRETAAWKPKSGLISSMGKSDPVGRTC